MINKEVDSGTIKRKFPSASVCVPNAVAFTIIETFVKGEPLLLSVILPVINLFCVSAAWNNTISSEDKIICLSNCFSLITRKIKDQGNHFLNLQI